MSIYENLQALALAADQRANDYYNMAGRFPHKLLEVIEEYLGCQKTDLEILWRPWPGRPNSEDVDEEGFFNLTIGIKLRLVKPGIEWLQIYSTFMFRPARDGVIVYLIRQQTDKVVSGTEVLTTYDSASFKPLLDQQENFLREVLNADPFTSKPNRNPMGYIHPNNT
jgi:hypothetical protein